MSRTINIDPVTRIEGHAKVHIEIGDNNEIDAAFMHILEFRGFEKFVQGMQVELMPTLTSRICGTCPHAHHLVAAKVVDQVFSAKPPRAAVLLRELLNCGSMIHSHAIHFFALAGPDLLLGIDAPAAKRNIMTLLDEAPDLASKALRLRTLGQKIAENIGGRGTHPVTAIAGGLATPLTPERRSSLFKKAEEALQLTKLIVQEGKKALGLKKVLLSILPIKAHSLGTVNNEDLELYDGELLAQRPDGSEAGRFSAAEYRSHLFEEAMHHTYAKRVLYKDPKGQPADYRVGPLARLNCAQKITTPLASKEFNQFKSKAGNPCHYTVMNHYARLIELLYCAEKAVEILNDDEILSPQVRTKISSTPKSAVAHIEAPRGVLIHDYTVDENGIVQGANFIVATQHNISLINKSIKAAASHFINEPDEVLINGIEFAIRCYDPCLSCSTHQLGQMPLSITIARNGRVMRELKR